MSKDIMEIGVSINWVAKVSVKGEGKVLEDTFQAFSDWLAGELQKSTEWQPTSVDEYKNIFRLPRATPSSHTKQ